MRLTFIMAVAITMLFASCQNSGGGEAATTDSTSAPAESKQERNKKIVMASNEAMMKHDLNAVFKDGAADFVDYGDGSMPPMKNLDSIKAMITGWMAAFPDMKGEKYEYYADGDKVLVYGEYSGTWTGDMMGMKGNGKKFSTRDVDIFTLNEEGKITSHRSVQNWMATLGMQLDMKMPK